MPEWLVERGIGETRAVLVDRGEILEARIELDDTVAAGTVLSARLKSSGGANGRALAVDESGTEFILPRGAPGIVEGAQLSIEVTRPRIPGNEPWKRPQARVSDKRPRAAPDLAEQLGGRVLPFPAASDGLAELGWRDLVEEARTGMLRFAGGELRISTTPAMTLIDVDGYLPAEELAVAGAREAAKAIRRLDIGGSIGIDLPTTGSRAARQHAASVLDPALPQPFERTAVNGFGFVQIVRPRSRASLVELAQDRGRFEARALLRGAAFDGPGPKRLVAHGAVIRAIEDRPDWLETLARQVGGAIELRAEAGLPISGGYVEKL